MQPTNQRINQSEKVSRVCFAQDFDVVRLIIPFWCRSNGTCTVPKMVGFRGGTTHEELCQTLAHYSATTCAKTKVDNSKGVPQLHKAHSAVPRRVQTGDNPACLANMNTEELMAPRTARIETR